MKEGDHTPMQDEATGIIDLSSLRADGWAERLIEEAPAVAQLFEHIGKPFVALAVLLGVRVVSLRIDARASQASVVEFEVQATGRQQMLPVGEFRRRLTEAWLQEALPPAELDDEPSLDDIQEYLGLRSLLLAPVLGVSLVQMRREDDERPRFVAEIASHRLELEREQLHRFLQERMVHELRRLEERSALTLDLSAVERAEEAAEQGTWSAVVELLGWWPGALSVLLRTAEGQRLEGETRSTIVRGLLLLGRAFLANQQEDWAEEVFRLAVQWSQDEALTALTFRHLAETCMVRERFGEAIGLLRRALSLGDRSYPLYRDLARCFAERGRLVAAAACVEEALELGGSEDETLVHLRERLASLLGSPWQALRRELEGNTALLS